MSDNPESGMDDFENFLNNLEDHEALFDPSQAITIRSSSGGTFEVPTTDPMTIAAALETAGLTVGQNVEYWVNNNRVQADQVVAPGAIVAAVGRVKGG